ncbi:MAG: MFS transporter [Dehalococcoidia bacterium]|nr:MAG: MFS transporter [Dehalococcoidia bacterium]
MSIAQSGCADSDDRQTKMPSLAPAAQRRRLRTFDALSIGSFRLLIASNLLQFAGMQMMGLVQGVLVFRLTGSFTALGLTALASAIPGLMLYPVGGVVADRFAKKTVLLSGQAAVGIVCAGLALLAAFGVLSYWHLLVGAALQGGLQAITTPSRHTIIPDIVGRERMMNAIGLNTSGTNFMQLVGPGIGGALIATVSAAWAFGVMAALPLLAAALSARLPRRPLFALAEESARAGAAPRRPGGFGDLAQGALHMARNQHLRTLITVNFVIVLLSMPYMMMLPGYVEEVLGKGAAEQGILVGISGVGAMLGSLVIASLPPRQRGPALVGVASIMAVTLIAFSLNTHYVLMMPIMLALGISSAMRLSLGQVLIQTYSEDEYRGRVVSVWMMQYSVVSLGTFGVGFLAEWLGPQRAIGGMAVTLLMFTLVVGFFTRGIRRLQ